MKKKGLLTIMMALIMALTLLAGCGSSGGQDTPGEATTDPDIESCETFGDLFAIDRAKADDEFGPFYNYAYTEDTFIYGIELNGIVYRVTAPLSEEVSAALWDSSVLDDDHDAQVEAAVRDLKFETVTNLTEQIPTQEEVDQLVGMTGQELFDEGFTSSGWYLEEKQFWFSKGPFTYTIIFDGSFDDVDWENFEDEDMADLVVVSATCDGVTDPCYFEEDM